MSNSCVVGDGNLLNLGELRRATKHLPDTATINVTLVGDLITRLGLNVVPISVQVVGNQRVKIGSAVWSGYEPNDYEQVASYVETHLSGKQDS